MSAIQPTQTTAEQPESPAVTAYARKCLAGVAHMQGEWGLHMIADVLRGSEKKRVLENELDDLSVHGLLDTLTRTKIIAMLELLLDHSLIRRGAHDTLGLTPLGTAVMLEKRTLSEQAKHALVKAQQVSSKRAMAQRYDSNSWSLNQTLNALRGGHHPADIAQFRNLAESTICEHMMCLAARGERFNLTPHLDKRLLEELRDKAAGWQPGDSMGPVCGALDEECDWTKLKMHLVQVFFD